MIPATGNTNLSSTKKKMKQLEFEIAASILFSLSTREKLSPKVLG